MLFVFLVAVRSSDSVFHLSPPFQREVVREIGEWTLRGQAVAQKRVIHLTSGIANISGGVCCRIPTNAQEFDVDIEMQLKQDAFVFTFSRNVCPDISSFFNGLNLSLVPSGNDSLRVSLSGAELFPNQLKVVEKFDFSQKFTVSIKKNTENFSVYIKSIDKEPLFTMRLSRMYEFGYISLFSYSPATCNSCITNVYNLFYFPKSVTHAADPNISTKNRKILKTSSESRELLKMERRGRMDAVSKYIELSLMANDTLNDDPVRVQEAFKEVKETVKRASSRISAEDLNVMLNTKVRPVLDKAAARYEKVALSLFHTKSEMNTLWMKVTSDLRTLRTEINIECGTIEAEARVTMSKLAQSKKELSVDGATQKNSFSFLNIICLIEFIAYIIFFIKQHIRLSSKKLF